MLKDIQKKCDNHSKKKYAEYFVYLNIVQNVAIDLNIQILIWMFRL